MTQLCFDKISSIENSFNMRKQTKPSSENHNFNLQIKKSWRTSQTPSKGCTRHSGSRVKWQVSLPSHGQIMFAEGPRGPSRGPRRGCCALRVRVSCNMYVRIYLHASSFSCGRKSRQENHSWRSACSSVRVTFLSTPLLYTIYA